MDDALKTITTQGGVLGALLVITLLALAWAIKMLLAEKEKRIVAAEKTRDDIAEPLKNIQKTQDLIYDKIVISKEAQS